MHLYFGLSYSVCSCCFCICSILCVNLMQTVVTVSIFICTSNYVYYAFKKPKVGQVSNKGPLCSECLFIPPQTKFRGVYRSQLVGQSVGPCTFFWFPDDNS